MILSFYAQALICEHGGLLSDKHHNCITVIHIGACVGPWTFSQKFNITTIVAFNVLWVRFYCFCQNISSCWAKPSSWLGVHLIRGIQHKDQQDICQLGYMAQKRQRERVSECQFVPYCELGEERSCMKKKEKKPKQNKQKSRGKSPIWRHLFVLIQTTSVRKKLLISVHSTSFFLVPREKLL